MAQPHRYEYEPGQSDPRDLNFTSDASADTHEVRKKIPPRFYERFLGVTIGAIGIGLYVILAPIVAYVFDMSLPRPTQGVIILFIFIGTYRLTLEALIYRRRR